MPPLKYGKPEAFSAFPFDSSLYVPSNSDSLDVFNLLHFVYEKYFENAEILAPNEALESRYNLRQLNPLLNFQLVTISNHIVSVLLM